MPIYAYACAACGHHQDHLQKMADPLITICPSCGAESYSKQLSAPQFQLKGGGWYVTDFRDNGKKDGKKTDAAGDGKSDAKSDSSGADGGSGETKSDTKTEAKVDSKPAETKTETKAPAPAPSSGGDTKAA
jgi:putative FmdB family regulatory protein